MTEVIATAAGGPTVVLVHGAFADASWWAGVVAHLQAAGLPVLAPANPLRGLADDSAYLTGVLDTIPGPVVLAAHSYGGAVITNAGARAERAIGLVYVAAYAPDEGESVREVGARFPEGPLMSALQPVRVTAGEPEIDVVIDPAAFREVFAADLAPERAAVLAVSQRPLQIAPAFAAPSGPAAWKLLPSWWALPTADRAIPPDEQRFFAARAGAITVEIDASHAVAISRPREIADLIRAAVGSLA